MTLVPFEGKEGSQTEPPKKRDLADRLERNREAAHARLVVAWASLWMGHSSSLVFRFSASEAKRNKPDLAYTSSPVKTSWP